MKINCPHCSARYEIDDHYLGKQLTCPQCQKAFMINASFSAAVSSASRPQSTQDSGRNERAGTDVARWILMGCVVIMFLCSFFAAFTGYNRRFSSHSYPDHHEEYKYHGDLINHLHYKATLELKHKMEVKMYYDAVRAAHREAALYFILAGCLFAGGTITATILYVKRKE